MSNTPLTESSFSNDSFFGWFVKNLIDEARWTPRIQLERAIGPLLTPFIARLMSNAVLPSSHRYLSGSYRLICDEFPLLKSQENQESTSVDWLLLNESSGDLIFLELKTNSYRIREKQLEIYSALRAAQDEKDRNEPIGLRLRDNFVALCRLKEILGDSGEREYRPGSRSLRDRKYFFQFNKLKDRWEDREACLSHRIRIVYLAPLKVRAMFEVRTNGETGKEKPDHTIIFKDLPGKIEGEHSSVWPVIHQQLKRLDGDE